MKTNIDPFMKALALLIIFSCFTFAATYKPHSRGSVKIAKVKSRLKQIGTTVAMYYTDGLDIKFPQNPSLFEIDSSLIYTEQTENWFELSVNSPYIFFPNAEDQYTGSPDKPLAMNWEALHTQPYYLVVWEDGHVSSVSPEEAEKMKYSTLKNQMTCLLYKFLFKNNQALQ